MAQAQAGDGLDVRFSHVAIGVRDVDRSLAFYRDVLGMDVVFDRPLSGAPFAGRAAGGVLGGVFVELIRLEGQNADEPGRGSSSVGVQVLSLSVPSLAAAHSAVRNAVGHRAGEPFDVDGVRMFFVTDPDGTVIEFIEFPGSARNPAELHRGVSDGMP